MSGDYSRFTDRPRRRYSGVLMQQGRVQLDADWNEEVDILARRWETQAMDTFGPCAVPAATTPDGFKVTQVAGDLQLGAGRIYVDGLLAEIFPGEQVDGKPVSYLHQPFLPAPPALPGGDAIVYVDVWQREVTWVEDRDLLEKALGGVDTAARRQTVWQVRVDAVPQGQPAECGAALPLPSSGRLSSRAVAPPASDDPCILSPTGGYRGLENRLYRVEVHTPGGIGGIAPARLKWSKENASIVSPVSKIEPDGAVSRLTVGRIGRDKVLRFQVDNWVEVLDDYRELMGEPGEMARVTAIDEAAQTIKLDRPIPAGGSRPFGANALELSGRHTRVRRWDQTQNLDANGLITPVPLAWLPIEDGVEVRLSPNGGTLRTGDFWVFAARTADGSVEELAEAPPRGILHHYGQLAAISGGKVHDCRNLWPPPSCCCCTAEVGDGKTSHGDYDDLHTAVAELTQWTPQDQPIRICLMPGVHELRRTLVLARGQITIRGCGRAARVIAPDKEPGIVVEGASGALEHLYLTSEARTVEAPAVLWLGSSGRAERNEIQTAGAPAVLSHAQGLRVLDNALSHVVKETRGETGSALFGLLVLAPGTRQARVAGNRIGPGLGDGIVLGRESLQDVLVRGNEIHGVTGCGIASRLKLPSKDVVEDKELLVLYVPNRVDGLRIESNTITRCVGASPPPIGDGLPHGGVVLARVAHVRIAGNRIEDNGTQPKAGVPVAGIYVRDCKGLVVCDNVVLGNGAAPGGERIPGPQGGILGEDLSVIVETVEISVAGAGKLAAPLQPDGWPAAAIHHNVVAAPRGHALLLTGIGPMMVTDNRFTARDVLAKGLKGQAPQDVVGAVYIVNTGLPAYILRQLLAVGYSNKKVLDPGSELDAYVVSGKVDFTDNQVCLDLVRGEVEVALAAIAILTLDDLAFQNNQTEQTLALDLLLIDTFALATTVRATGNGLTESLALAFISLWAAGFLMCTATSNQATHCIIAEALSGQLVKDHNLSPFCSSAFSEPRLFPKP